MSTIQNHTLKIVIWFRSD